MISNRLRAGAVLAAAVALLWSCAGVALAQGKKKEAEEKNRTLSGVVLDPNDAAVAGAIVQLKNSKTLQVRSFITKEDGSYFFSGLDPDTDYIVKADHQGMSSPQRTISSFDSRKRPVVNLKLEKK
jgi:hypothetical protein